MRKRERQKLLESIIDTNEIETQEELLRKLQEHGVQATQATISRDIRELKIVKVRSEVGKTFYRIYKSNVDSQNEHFKEMFAELVLKISQVEFLTILHTTTGSADLVATLLEELNLKEIVATMAGTDTLLIISQTPQKAHEVVATLQPYLGKKEA